jgi:hypothetical protein
MALVVVLPSKRNIGVVCFLTPGGDSSEVDRAPSDPFALPSEPTATPGFYIYLFLCESNLIFQFHCRQRLIVLFQHD